jgi:hypothetical protein
LGRLSYPRDAGSIRGIVYDQPNEQSAIKQAIDEFKVPANQHG